MNVYWSSIDPTWEWNSQSPAMIKLVLQALLFCSLNFGHFVAVPNPVQDPEPWVELRERVQVTRRVTSHQVAKDLIEVAYEVDSVQGLW